MRPGPAPPGDVVRRAEERHGGVDVLVNNAGYGLVGAVEEVSEAEAREIVDADLLGALWLTQAVLPGMRARGSGHVLQISTTGAVGAMPFLGLYNAAKWGLEGFSEALAGEVREFGVRVSIAELGAVDTQWGTGSMRFAAPDPAYDAVRDGVLGTSEVPWLSEPGATGGGTAPREIAEELLRHVEAPSDGRLRLLVGDDAPGQVAAVLRRRLDEYALDPRFATAEDAADGTAEA
ncbi:SDR family NAD(P)-dependent oxidoreductase [Rothia sp. AR01]|uniref:SDR family NAD(P)-dependent oxidoreductase n=1 Tax=Rothia santali TaxID=2949643 RepID=A0A9X2HEP9_9MICC|nr:SDR family NAD(P)-dependent oxidoreductase [Rothia santali]MCP3426342.1 SDR family NAD(P)-dependent oxidoreductase [Rothia santali]